MHKKWMQNWGGAQVIRSDTPYIEPNTGKVVDQERIDRSNEYIDINNEGKT